jgi:hypothetical protein
VADFWLKEFRHEHTPIARKIPSANARHGRFIRFVKMSRSFIPTSLDW